MKKFINIIINFIKNLFSKNVKPNEIVVPDPDATIVSSDELRKKAIIDVESLSLRPRRKMPSYEFFDTFTEAFEYMVNTFNVNLTKAEYLKIVFSKNYKEALQYFIYAVRVGGFGSNGIDSNYPIRWIVATPEQIAAEGGAGKVGRQAYRDYLKLAFSYEKLINMAMLHRINPANKLGGSFNQHITSTCRKFKNVEEIKNILNNVE